MALFSILHNYMDVTRKPKFHRRFDRYRRRTEFSPTISLLATVNFSFHRRFSLSTASPVFHRRFPHPNVRNHINPPSIRTKTHKKEELGAMAEFFHFISYL